MSNKIAIIPNGIFLHRGAPVTGDDILYVGRLIEAKGVHHLIDAMRLCPDEHLVIVGDGPESERLKEAIRGRTNVVLAGHVPHEELGRYFDRAKILVMPSLRDEGMPNAVMEAMNRGIPVVASRVAGIPDLVIDGETGIIVSPGDARALASAIRTLSRDAAFRARLSRESLEAVRRYDWSNVVASTVHELEKLVPR